MAGVTRKSYRANCTLPKLGIKSKGPNWLCHKNLVIWQYLYMFAWRKWHLQRVKAPNHECGRHLYCLGRFGVWRTFATIERILGRWGLRWNLCGHKSSLIVVLEEILRYSLPFMQTLTHGHLHISINCVKIGWINFWSFENVKFFLLCSVSCTQRLPRIVSRTFVILDYSRSSCIWNGQAFPIISPDFMYLVDFATISYSFLASFFKREQ